MSLLTTFECPNNHLVLGGVICPKCVKDPEPRWEKDPYIVSNADMSYERGLLKGNSLNDIQLALLVSVIARREKTKRADVESQFEQQMFVTNPEMWQRYKEQKKLEVENSGLTEAPIWVAPQTLDEAEELNKILDDLDRKFKSDLLRQEAEGVELTPQLRAFIHGLDVNELGEEE